jgi:hypothetical protein
MKKAGDDMKLDEKLIRGKSVLSPDAEGGKEQYNVWHILAGTVLMILVPLAVFLLSGGNERLLNLSVYATAAAVGLLVGWLAGCVPSITLLIILFAATGKGLFRLFGGQMGRFGSAQFNKTLLAWLAVALLLFGAAFLGSKAREGRGRPAGGSPG